MVKFRLNLLISLFIIGGCSNSLPTYELEENFNTTVIDGVEYALHKLMINGNTYISEPEQYIKSDYYDEFKIGRKIGKTDDGMEIYQVENDENRLVIKGFMYPADFFKLESSP
ncbi:hypothetical protein CJ195_23875 [Bacillus sp. UMB0899]|nr:hypothetical protein CJ195_23875 [Bacillus sp. UMB0899]